MPDDPPSTFEAEGDDDAPHRGVRSIEVGARLLEVLASHPGSMQLRDIAEAARIPPSKAHRYLASLISVGLVEAEPVRGAYNLGPMSLRLGLAALHRRDSVNLALRALLEYGEREDATAALAVWGDHGPTVVGWHDSSHPLIFNLGIGSTLSMLRTATGRVFLAYLPHAVTRRLVEHELGIVARYSPTDGVRSWEDVRRLVQETRSQGFGATHGELVPGSSAIAAPIFDHQGRLVAALLHIGLTAQIHSTVPPPALALCKAADEVSLKLGFDRASGSRTLVEQLEKA